MLIGSYCPSTLYPYAREAISDVVVKGGFPQLLLQPINFDALYAQALQQRAGQNAAAGDAPSGALQESPAEPGETDPAALRQPATFVSNRPAAFRRSRGDAPSAAVSRRAPRA